MPGAAGYARCSICPAPMLGRWAALAQHLFVAVPTTFDQSNSWPAVLARSERVPTMREGPTPGTATSGHEAAGCLVVALSKTDARCGDLRDDHR
jgi:hypothetical protein